MYQDNNGTKTTWYVRDASGNVMSVYTLDQLEETPVVGGGDSPGPDDTPENTNNMLVQRELHLYGSSRLGIVKPDLVLDPSDELAESGTYMPGLGKWGIDHNFIRGKKVFELSNHLGNVLATITDRKIGVDEDDDANIDYYEADVLTANDYYPFGMQMPGREYNLKGYRYGFNGKENDNEVKGEGNQQDYGMRIYDPRLGRFLSVDPLTKNFPMLTCYQFSNNSPIAMVDLDGKEGQYYTTTYTYITYHHFDPSTGQDKTTQTLEVNVEKKETGLFANCGFDASLTNWSIYTPHGPLGTGTMYTVQTQAIDIYEVAIGELGSPIRDIQTIRSEGPMIILLEAYWRSPLDTKLRNEEIKRPQYTGSLQIMILGSGNGLYPTDQTGSSPNPNAEKTILINMKEFSEVIEPILLAKDIQEVPGKIGKPGQPKSLNDLLNDYIGQKIDEANAQSIDKIYDASGSNTPVSNKPEPVHITQYGNSEQKQMKSSANPAAPDTVISFKKKQ